MQLPHYLNGSTKGLSNWMNFAGRLLNWKPLQCLVSITVRVCLRSSFCAVNVVRPCVTLAQRLLLITFFLVALLDIGSSSTSVCWVLRFKWLPYCYYYLRVLYFANFCDLEKIAKLNTRKNFYRHI